MKKLFLFAALAAMTILPACNEKMDGPAMPRGERVVLDVTITAPTATKAVGDVNTDASDNDTAGERTVNNLQVFVFNGDIRDGYISANSTSASVECTSGQRDIYCIVNGPSSLGSLTTKTALLAATNELVNNNSSFTMIGSKTAQAIAAGTNNISVPVNRIASKIVVKSITNALKSGGAMTVRRVYITNVAGQINYGLDTYAPADGTWYNKGGYKANGNLGAFTNDINLSANVAANGNYNTNHYFYAYPNNYAQADYNPSGWAPKRTMLVVQIEYQGALYDYPIDLGVNLESNKMYVIQNLRLENLGNADDGEEGGADEENPVSGATASVTITVEDWSVVNLGTNGNIVI